MTRTCSRTTNVFEVPGLALVEECVHHSRPAEEEMVAGTENPGGFQGL